MLVFVTFLGALIAMGSVLAAIGFLTDEASRKTGTSNR